MSSDPIQHRFITVGQIHMTMFLLSLKTAHGTHSTSAYYRLSAFNKVSYVVYQSLQKVYRSL